MFSKIEGPGQDIQFWKNRDTGREPGTHFLKIGTLLDGGSNGAPGNFVIFHMFIQSSQKGKAHS